MRLELRKLFGQLILGFAFYVLPNGVFKISLAKFLVDNIKKL